MAQYTTFSDISFLESNFLTKEELTSLWNNDFFANPDSWINSFSHTNKETIDRRRIKEAITSPLKKRMSELSLGIYYVAKNGPLQHSTLPDEIYLFTGFAEIETTNQIIKSITIDNSRLVSPTLFHNSVHNTPLGYLTIIEKMNNYCVTVSDGMKTVDSFIEYIRLKAHCDKPYIVVAGEEHSPFYKLDTNSHHKIVPAFTAGRMIPGSTKGFLVKDTFNDLKYYLDTLSQQATQIISDITTFNELSNKTSIPHYTDYPLTYDNPTNIVFRICFPFYLQLPGITHILTKTSRGYSLIEVSL